MNESPMHNAHEQLLGTLLAFPNTLKDYSYELEPDLFFGFNWLYSMILQVDTEEGFTYRGLINRLSTEQIRIVQVLRQSAIGESMVPWLLEQSKKALLAHRLRELGAKLARTDEDPDEALRELQEHTDNLQTSERRAMSNPDADLEEYFTYMEEIADNPQKAYGLMTSIPELDALTTGLHRQDFSVLGARTSMGKSAFMLQLALNIHQRGHKVAIYSLEMSKRQIYTRLMSNLLGIHAKVFKLGTADRSHYERMRTFKETLRGLYIDDTRGVSSEYIADSMYRLKRTQGLDFVVVDYLQDVQEAGEKNDNQGSALARVCRKLRKAAKTCDCHLMGLSQIARAAEQGNADKRPKNSDLSGSTGIETSADVIALLYRDDYYNPETSERKNILEVNFTKVRNGELGRVDLYYDRDTQRIRGLAR